jgi:hypothetical protein
MEALPLAPAISERAVVSVIELTGAGRTRPPE